MRKTVFFNALPPPYPFDEDTCEDENEECNLTEDAKEDEHKCVCKC